MITDQQVVLLRQKLMEGKTQQAAAASSATSERSVRRWQRGALPSDRRRNRRGWRTRPDPFADVWERDVEPLLRSDPEGELSATTILEWLDERHPGRFSSSQLRTLQRRIRDHRALHGPDREVYFQQDHPPGREAQVDFTHCSGLGVTIGGEPFRHLLFHLALSHSGWSYAEVCFGETFAALVKGLQGALWELGGVPRVVRTDNLSAATHDLRDSRGRAVNASYEAVLAHYGVEATRTNPRSSHENGVVEQRHRRLKNALDQALILRGSRDFESEQEYRTFVRRIVDRRNRLVQSKVKRERRHLRPLPPAPVPEYVNYRVRVRRWSTIRVANRTYSVPSRLIGMVVDVRLYADHIECTTRTTSSRAWSGYTAQARRRSTTATSSDRWFASQGRSHGTASGSRCSRLTRSGWRTTRCVDGEKSVPTSSTFASCTWPRQPWSRRWTGRSGDCLSPV